ncbi:unnamed protein product [Dracunculus medinensis]|uniref:AATF-Che1 domain-containing protein n=1 Tax=Dracunculus medinensis TaxID=318479 RepID=A0A0N4ULY2_DRAME|nr:unnamed protein product [Dracunculus medinensis]
MAELPDVEDNNNVGESWANRPRENEYDDVLKTYGCEQRRLFNAFDENDHRYDGNKVSTKEIFNHEQMQDLYTIRQIRGKGNSSILDQNGIEDNEDDANDFRLIEVNTDNDVSDNDYEMNEDGESIRLQLNLYDRLMHLQIKLHAALRVFNQLPRGMLAISLLRSVDRETKRKYLQELKLMRKRTASMISTLLAIEELMLEGSNQTKNISSGKNISEIEDSENEKITSSEDEKSDEDDPTSRENHKSNSKNIDGPCLREKKSFKFFKMLLNERHDRFQNFRNSTLSKWDERTRLIGNFSVKNAKKDFSGFESLILKQIENVVSSLKLVNAYGGFNRPS